MFTGIVECTGWIASVARQGRVRRVRIEARLAGPRLALGESVCVDGVCLTVTRRGRSWFEVDLSPETVRVTTLGERGAGGAVNLERALRAGDRLGGHLVQGHVDAVGHVARVRREGATRVVTFSAPPEVAGSLVRRGSVAIDGVSLTITALGRARFDVVLIPHTLAVTTLKELSAGRAVNLEADILGKYVLEFLGRTRRRRPAATARRGRVVR
jgi:riboflavin synthase